MVLAQGSSDRQLAPASSVDLVLTDPPYFDDVQYAELAGMFLAWARATGLVPDSVELDLRTEAVSNVERGIGVDRYRGILRAIFKETRRTIKPAGRMILTYHNTDLRAWWALGSALREARLYIHALAVAHAENERDHAKRGRLAFSRDLVIECCHHPVAEAVVAWCADGSGAEAHELLVAGRAIATMPPTETLPAFRRRFQELRGDIQPVRIGPRKGARKELQPLV